MSAGLLAVREELRVLARMYGAGSGADYKALCLAVIDRAATCASDRHGEMSADVLGHLTRAMHAASREDVAGVIEEVEGALALLHNPSAILRKPTRPPVPSCPPSREGQSRAKSAPKGRTGKAQAIAETIDPLLAKLRATNPPKG